MASRLFPPLLWTAARGRVFPYCFVFSFSSASLCGTKGREQFGRSPTWIPHSVSLEMGSDRVASCGEVSLRRRAARLLFRGINFCLLLEVCCNPFAGIVGTGLAIFLITALLCRALWVPSPPPPSPPQAVAAGATHPASYVSLILANFLNTVFHPWACGNVGCSISSKIDVLQSREAGHPCAKTTEG